MTQFAAIRGSLLLAMSLEPAEIGTRIREARLRKGWTQLQLALEADVSPSTVTRWERGGLPPMRELIRLAGVLEVPAEALVDSPPSGDGVIDSARLALLEERVGEALVLLHEVRAAVLAQAEESAEDRPGTSRVRLAR
jgi:transcriptional regulator with XRE-family HTH domain